MNSRRLTPDEARELFRLEVRRLDRPGTIKGGESEMAFLLSCSRTTVDNVLAGEVGMEIANRIEAMFKRPDGAPLIPMNSWCEPPQMAMAQRIAG